jgi:hypothetical protein
MTSSFLDSSARERPTFAAIGHCFSGKFVGQIFGDVAPLILEHWSEFQFGKFLRGLK